MWCPYTLGATVAAGKVIHDIVNPSAEDHKSMIIAAVAAPPMLMLAPLLVIGSGAVFGAGAGLFAAGICQNPALTMGISLSTYGIYKQATAKPLENANVLNDTPNIRSNP